MKKIKDVLTGAEIERLYPNHWIILNDYKYSKQMKLLRGRVISAHEDKLEMYESLKTAESPFAIHVTRKPDPKIRRIGVMITRNSQEHRVKNELSPSEIAERARDEM